MPGIAHSSRSLLVALAASLAACGGAGDGAEPIAETEQPVRGGTETTRIGVVEIITTTQCSGVMISPNVVLTAGHCVVGALPPGAKSGVVDAISIQYKFPDGTTREVAGDEGLSVTLWPDYTSPTDAANDFAVIKTNGRWTGTKSTDYAYIYTDTMGAYSRYQLYGYGHNAFGGGGDGVLRTGTMEVDWFGSHHFILIGRGARACRGDSGGPWTVYESTTGSEMHVAGLMSSVVLTPGGYCGAEGANARATRLSAKVDWIKQTTGARCVQMKSQTTNRLVTRCFDYTTLKRTVRDCRTKAALGPEQTIDLSTGYSNYKCGNRYQEQCVDDGSADSYYVESCQ
jgi:hypothetical protein